MSTEPIAQRVKQTVKLGNVSGDRGKNLMDPPVELTDHYYWLRSDKRDDKKVLSYLKSENDYTESVMNSHKLHVDNMFNEIKSHIKETDQTYPRPKRSWNSEYRYFTRTIEGKSYPIYCRTNSTTEEILIDVNVMAEGKTNYDLTSFIVTNDHKLMSYGIDESGNEKYKLVIQSIDTKETIPHNIPDLMYCSYFWYKDYIFYEMGDETNRMFQVWVYNLNNKENHLLFENSNALESVSVSMSNDETHFFISSSSYDSSETYYFTKDNFNPVIFSPKKEGVLYEVTYHQGRFLIITNADNCRNFKIMQCDNVNTSSENWSEFITYDKTMYIEDIHELKDYLLVVYKKSGTNKIKAIKIVNGEYDFNNAYDIELDLESSIPPNIDLICVDIYDTNKIWFSHESLDTPVTLYEWNLNDKSYKTLFVKSVPNFNREHYQSERIFAKSHDGTMVPMSIVYKKNLFNKNSSNPLYLYGYGSYGCTIDPNFSSKILPLLNRGFVYVIAHVRGSSFLGYEWYEAGKMETKINTFKDFIACAEHLISKGYTFRKGITIEGRSAGGLLIGACMTMRPDLFHTVIGGVPFVDVLTTMSDPSIPLTTEEWEQWGNPNQEKFYILMKEYSPYDNIRPTTYPHVLMLAGLNDPRVAYWEPAKFVAKLRFHRTDKNLLLLKTEMDEGHFGGSDRYKYIKQMAFSYVFVLKTYNLLVKI